jgi:beta-galactosidase
MEKATLTEMQAGARDAAGWQSVTCTYQLPGADATWKIQYKVDGKGALWVTNDFVAGNGKQPMLFKVGNYLPLSGGFSTLEWYGCGPVESYPDRKAGYPVGLYNGPIADQYYPYIRPQESGNKTEVRWAKLARPDGSGILVQSRGSLLNINALPYHPDQLYSGPEKRQAHHSDLVPDGKVHLHIDHKMMGLGSIDSWGALPMEAYRLPYQSYRYEYLMVPY